MAADLQTIVQRMIDAGESEDSIAEVIREYPKAQSGSTVTPYVTAAGGAAKLAPGIVAGVSKAAPMVAKLGSRGVAPATLGVMAGADVIKGNYKAAAIEGAGAVAPAIAKGVVKATEAAGSRVSPILSASGDAMSVATKAGPIMRGASWLSRAAGTASVPLTMLSLLMDAKAQTDALEADQSISPEEKQRIRQRLARPFEQ